MRCYWSFISIRSPRTHPTLMVKASEEHTLHFCAMTCRMWCKVSAIMGSCLISDKKSLTLAFISHILPDNIQ